MSVGEFCSRAVDTIEPHESAYLAAERMLQRGVGSLVVVGSNEHPIGIVTDRDLVERVLAKGLDPAETPVQDVMSTGLNSVPEESAIESALWLMRTGKFRRLPVIDAQRKLVGLISLDDILMLLASEFTQIGSLLEKETPRCVVTAQP